MSVWTFIKLLAAVTVMGVLGITALLTYHVVVRPLGGYFEAVVPSARTVAGEPSDVDFVKMVDAAEMPDIDPGVKVYQKALELIALGEVAGAREKLNSIINVFPTSSSAPEARRIVGQMNLDEILSTTHLEGKQTHVVKRGDSYLAIAGKYRTTLDCILYLNGMAGLKNLQPGEELVVMPLDFRVLIEPQRMSVSLWAAGRFICEYPIRRLGTSNKLGNQSVTIQAKAGQLDGRAIKTGGPQAAKPTPPKAKGTQDAALQVPPPVRKSLQLAKLPLRITAYTPDDGDGPGIFLSPEDFEELFLLTRVGNTVEIRNAAK